MIDDMSIDDWAKQNNLTLGEAIQIILIYAIENSFDLVPSVLRKTLRDISDADIREAMETFTEDREARSKEHAVN